MIEDRGQIYKGRLAGSAWDGSLEDYLSEVSDAVPKSTSGSGS